MHFQIHSILKVGFEWNGGKNKTRCANQAWNPSPTQADRGPKPRREGFRDKGDELISFLRVVGNARRSSDRWMTSGDPRAGNRFLAWLETWFCLSRRGMGLAEGEHFGAWLLGQKNSSLRSGTIPSSNAPRPRSGQSQSSVPPVGARGVAFLKRGDGARGRGGIPFPPPPRLQKI